MRAAAGLQDGRLGFRRVLCRCVVASWASSSGPTGWSCGRWAGLSCGLKVRFTIHLYENTGGIFPAQIQEPRMRSGNNLNCSCSCTCRIPEFFSLFSCFSCKNGTLSTYTGYGVGRYGIFMFPLSSLLTHITKPLRMFTHPGTQDHESKTPHAHYTARAHHDHTHTSLNGGLSRLVVRTVIVLMAKHRPSHEAHRLPQGGRRHGVSSLSLNGGCRSSSTLLAPEARQHQR
jgi:hypothetical protein